MTHKWLIDTDVLIDYFRGQPQAVTFLEKIIENSLCYISAITVAELFAGMREGKEKNLIEDLLNTVDILNISDDIARHGGLFRRDYGKSHGVGLADALIAATAFSCEAKMVTLNKKHFPMLENVFVPYAKGH